MRILLHASAAVVALCGSAALADPKSDIHSIENGSWPSIEAGQPVAGSLTAADLKRGDGTYADGYFYTAQAGETVTITQRSGDFDSWLVVDDPNGSMYEFNDDGGGGHDAQLQITFPHAGRYVILANAVNAAATGNYTLNVTQGAQGAASAAASSTPATVAMGHGSNDLNSIEARDWPVVGTGEFDGALTTSDYKRVDNTYADPFYYQADAGETVTVTMRSSDVDSWLVVDDPNGSTYQFNDDGAGGSDAQIKVTFPHAGRYLIIANAVSPNSTGRYTVSIASSP
jgi:plastocyanin